MGIKIDPDNEVLKFYLARLYCKQEKYKEALELFEETRRFGHFGYYSAVTGNREKAEKLLYDLIEKSQEYTAAMICAGLGYNNKAFELLNVVCEKRGHVLTFFKIDEEFDNLHSDSRFNDLLKKMGLPE